VGAPVRPHRPHMPKSASASVCLSRSLVVTKRIKISSKFFHHRVVILVFHAKRDGDIPTGRTPPPNGGVECRGGIGRNRDSGLTAGYRRLLDVRLRSAKNINYRRRSGVYDTVGNVPLAIDRLLDVRSTK